MKIAAALWMAVAMSTAAVAQESGPPRFRLGDDLAWAAPQYDDSQWALLPERESIRFADLKDNVAWTRWRVTVPADPPMMFRATCSVDCRAWIDGHPTGGGGDTQVVFPAPAGKSVVVAVRSWLPPGAAVYNRNSALIELRPSAEIAARPGGLVLSNDLLPQKVTSLVQAVILVYLLLQAFTAGSSREVRIRAALMAAFLLCAVISFATRDPRVQWTSSMGTIPTILAILALAGGGLPRLWIYVFVPCFLAIRLPYLIGMFADQATSRAGLAAQLHAASLPLGMILAVWLSWRAHRQGATGWVMAGSWVAILAFFLNATRPAGFPEGIPAGDLLFRWNNFGSVAFGLAIAVDVVHQNRNEQAAAVRLKGEMDSGRQAQLDLVSASSQDTPGYRIEVEYQPAAEVGGDFYVILPRSDGGTLVVVGDVSGKGLKAAMLTSFVIGVIRTRRDLAPGAILAAANDAMEEGAKGFITACAAVLGNNGSIAYANAGHLPPLLDEQELEAPAALPLGLAKGIEYPEALWTLEPGMQLTLLTDGVVEAAALPSGELFGFERTRRISRQSPREIAEAARAWGQNDDITVITIQCRKEGIG